jgi:hypothetical protein
VSKVQSNNKPHETAVTTSEGIRQNAASVSGTTAATAKTADIAHYRNCVASAIANGCSTNTFVNALRELGTGGT